MSAKRRVGVLISGRGSNLQALIDAAKAPDYPADLVLVISNVPGVQGLDRAEAAGIPTSTVNHRDFPSREAFEAALDEALGAAGVDLLCNAGFMRLLTEGFVSRWLDRHLNIHPSLLPAFKGLDTHARVLRSGARITGCTVHFVRAAMDDGPIVGQAAVPVLEGDTEEALAARVLAAEHRLYPHALRLVASGQVAVDGERVAGIPVRPDESNGADAPEGRGESALFSPPLRGNF
ncbi:phosphoribosylglycinamide formyltransferase [Methyloceanibacter methanicus]|uniref:phosphoribosylglycinamide formyltransferase n=1 Tax=Methyloceanibacter methanicus TaxID=1774968 RepID=UPI0008497282|nr:phosphoribosylglycinamide formyltransferase [Methyloceanibacter methanicus]